MAYKQVRDILQRVRQFHHDLGRYYEQLSRESPDERVTCLLDYMGRHEENLDQCLARYESQAAEGILNTWLQFVPEDTLQEAFRTIELKSEMSVDEVIQAVLQFDVALIGLYEELSHATAVPRVQELFSSLLELEQSKDRQYARSRLEP